MVFIVRVIIPKWPYDNSYFQVRDLWCQESGHPCDWMQPGQPGRFQLAVTLDLCGSLPNTCQQMCLVKTLIIRKNVRLFHIISPQWSSIHRPKLLYYGICIIENYDSYLPCIMKNWYFGISTFIILLNIPYTKVQIVHSIYTNRQSYQLLYLYSPQIQTLTQLFASTQLTNCGPFLYGIYTLW